jgi:hypothetical protein
MRHVGGLSLVWIRNNVVVQRNRLFAEAKGPFDSRFVE